MGRKCWRKGVKQRGVSGPERGRTRHDFRNIQEDTWEGKARKVIISLVGMEKGLA